jgi:dihydrofolate reductase
LPAACRRLAEADGVVSTINRISPTIDGHTQGSLVRLLLQSGPWVTPAASLIDACWHLVDQRGRHPFDDLTEAMTYRSGDCRVGRVKVAGFSLSLDGFGAGPEQSLEAPLGENGHEIFRWFFGTKTFKAMTGGSDGLEGVDNDFAHRAMDGFGAFIVGRNMFGPVRGDWPDAEWKGWWGDNPPYHAPTFILTHYPRDPIVMEGGTIFHFVTDGIHAALERAREAAGERDVKIGGGVSTARQYLQAGLIDELHFAVSPVLLGRGEAMFAGLDLPALGYRVLESTATELATHVVVGRNDKE